MIAGLLSRERRRYPSSSNIRRFIGIFAIVTSVEMFAVSNRHTTSLEPSS